ncbi:hypothetical protein HG531_010917 [Fusarium graminearum]|nr:hypothetical protein HG531_010917 [Fusarium graminearum]
MARLHTTIKFNVGSVLASLKGLEGETVSGPVGLLLEGEAAASLDISRLLSDCVALLLADLIRRARGQPLREQFGQLEHLVRPLVSRCVADQQEAVKLGASKRVDISEEREGLNAKKRDTDGGTWIIGVGPKSEMAERSLSRTWGPGPGDGQEGRRGSRFDRCSVVDVAVGYVHPLLVSWDPRLDPRELQRDEHWKEVKMRITCAFRAVSLSKAHGWTGTGLPCITHA